MKIGLVLSKPPGYSETFFNAKIKGLQENGHTVTLFTGPSQETYMLCKHVRSPKVDPFFLFQVLKMCWVGFLLLPHLKAVWTYVKLEKKEGASIKRILEKVYLNSQFLKFKGDWLHYGFATLAIDRELVAEAIDVKMAVSLRGFDINVYPLKHPGCYTLLWRQVDKVQSISNYLLEKAFKLGLPQNSSYQIITPAVNMEFLPSIHLDRTSNVFKITTIARFNWMKGIHYIIEVASYLKKANIAFEWQLIGSGHDFEWEHYLYLIHENHLENQVILTGACSHAETLNYLTTSDIYVQTSLNEGFCNAVLEAQAIGIPAIAFHVGGLPENILDTKTGWLIKPFEVESMAKRIIAYFNLTLVEKEKISKQAKERVKNHFNLQRQKQKFQEFYTR
ncbi:glycosyltransferase family 4 protein [Bizionia arctica]|uniref:Colanic acid biosynthesis glycosyltransferase WcaL n=1 Tax=Bizionia arctica TaxID=1495645 RepID=A0A917GNX9_9FLAO|nr:glycosyltransferase family 4 protein [Bizionia arctica]GGG53014.1 colanic acid biosynthesis glycosyltransferase WcaL [Bizionia arctica]